MQTAQYPSRKCREAVWGQYSAHACELPAMHTGPCASTSVKDSVTRRDRWEADNPDLLDKSSDGDVLL